MSVITNKDIIEFYSKKDDKECKFTHEFEKNHLQKGDGYIDTAKVFVGEKDDEEEKKFFQWLSENKGEIFALKYLNKDFDILLKNGVINQKWHCLVSWYARKEYMGELDEKIYSQKVSDKEASKICILKTQITCPELRLWLVESAKDGKIITDADVNFFSKAAITYSKNKIANKKVWNKVWTEIYRNKIEDIIKQEMYT